MNTESIKKRYAKVLIMTAVEAEQEAVVRGLGNSSRFDVRLAGVGPAAAAANTAAILAKGSYDLVISAGIAGGFADVAGIGSIVIANQIIAADFGAESPDGFISVDELGFGSSCIVPDLEITGSLAEMIQRSKLGIPVHISPIITVTTGTGTATTAELLGKRVPGAGAEGMEGYGVATAASIYGIPVIELRTISNAVGPRDRSAWRIKDALHSLEAASTILLEVLNS